MYAHVLLCIRIRRRLCASGEADSVWQARVWRARVAVRVGCREMRWVCGGGVIVGTRLWVARWDDMVRRQTSGASWCTVTISVAPSATTAAWTTSARAHRRKTQEMQTTAKAHNKPLRSEDSERDARVALVGSAVKVVSAHGHRVRRKHATAPAVLPCAPNVPPRESVSAHLGEGLGVRGAMALRAGLGAARTVG